MIISSVEWWAYYFLLYNPLHFFLLCLLFSTTHVYRIGEFHLVPDLKGNIFKILPFRRYLLYIFHRYSASDTLILKIIYICNYLKLKFQPPEVLFAETVNPVGMKSVSPVSSWVGLEWLNSRCRELKYHYLFFCTKWLLSYEKSTSSFFFSHSFIQFYWFPYFTSIPILILNYLKC